MLGQNLWQAQLPRSFPLTPPPPAPPGRVLESQVMRANAITIINMIIHSSLPAHLTPAVPSPLCQGTCGTVSASSFGTAGMQRWRLTSGGGEGFRRRWLCGVSLLWFQQWPQSGPDQSQGGEEVEHGAPAKPPDEGTTDQQPHHAAHVQAAENHRHRPRAFTPAGKQAGSKIR